MNHLLRRAITLTLLLASFGTGIVTAQEREVYLQLTISDRDQLEQLGKLVSIDSLRGNQVRAYALPAEIHRLRQAGFSWQQLPHPGLNPNARMGLQQRAASGSWDAYPSYNEYVAMMEGYEAAYPDLCRLHVIGDASNTVRPHQLLAVRISDNPDVQEDEPEVFLTSTMHGDETVGYVLLLHLIDELLSNHDPAAPEGSYAAQLTAMVDGMEIWINPLANPDGTYFASDDTVSGSQRRLVYTDGSPSPVDANRNFPDPEDGDHPDGYAWWPETVAMMELAATRHFVITANLHGGAEVVNYPWDTWQRRHADDRWFLSISRAYASRAQSDASAPPYNDVSYMTDLDNGITNGYDWYSVSGGRQDYMTFWHGARETTLEISKVKNPPASRLPALWDYSRRALLDYLANALEGVRGLVTDPSGTPLDAEIEVVWHDVAEDRSTVVSDADVGDYHRMLLPGSYWLLYRAAGHLSAVHRVEIREGPATRVDVVLEQDQGHTLPLVGVVRDARSGLPVSGATLTPAWPERAPVTTMADGSYLLEDLAEGACLLEVEAPGYQVVRTATEVRWPSATLEVWLYERPAPRRVAGRH